MRADGPADGVRRRARRTGGGGRAPRELRISLLGRFAITADGTERTLPRDGQRLVALLALGPQGVLRGTAARRLAPHLEDASAQASLRKTLTRRRATRLPLLEDDGAVLRPGPLVRADVWEAEALAKRLLANPDEEVPDDRLEILAREPLPGWSEGWAARARTAMRGRFLRVLNGYARRLADRGRQDRALAVAQQAWNGDPLHESTVAVIIEIHLADRNRRQALDAYDALETELDEGLGVEPSPELRELVAPLLRRRPRP